MSTQVVGEISEESGFPELSALGKRIELLRIERGLSKQRLARAAGTSRQQLWRVMTGKSELTTALCHRLAEVLKVDPRVLRQGPGSAADAPMADATTLAGGGPMATPEPFDLASYVAEPGLLLRTLSTLPSDAAGDRLRRELLNCVEDVAREAEVRLPGWFFELRGKVVNGEL